MQSVNFERLFAVRSGSRRMAKFAVRLDLRQHGEQLWAHRSARGTGQWVPALCRALLSMMHGKNLGPTGQPPHARERLCLGCRCTVNIWLCHSPLSKTHSKGLNHYFMHTKNTRIMTFSLTQQTNFNFNSQIKPNTGLNNINIILQALCSIL